MQLVGDRTVGRLVKWLRVLGISCDLKDFRSPTEVPSGVLYLTRKRGLVSERVLLVPYDRLEDQLRFIFSELSWLKEELNPFSLCLECNQPLEEVPKEKVFGLVPDFVFETRDHFRRCPRCQKIYWKGTHPERMKIFLERLGLLSDRGE